MSSSFFCYCLKLAKGGGKMTCTALGAIKIGFINPAHEKIYTTGNAKMNSEK